jgi:hypothetical protein
MVASTDWLLGWSEPFDRLVARPSDHPGPAGRAGKLGPGHRGRELLRLADGPGDIPRLPAQARRRTIAMRCPRATGRGRADSCRRNASGSSTDVRLHEPCVETGDARASPSRVQVVRLPSLSRMPSHRQPRSVPGGWHRASKFPQLVHPSALANRRRPAAADRRLRPRRDAGRADLRTGRGTTSRRETPLGSTHAAAPACARGIGSEGRSDPLSKAPRCR